TLADARAMLAATIYALDGAGFPPPASDDLVNQPALKDVWSGCVAAARTARDSDDRPKAPQGLHVLLWRPDPNDGTNPDRTGLDLQWPSAEGSRVKSSSGPISDGSDIPAKRLFFFDAINTSVAIDADKDASPGIWPKSLRAGLAARVAVTRET